MDSSEAVLQFMHAIQKFQNTVDSLDKSLTNQNEEIKKFTKSMKDSRRTDGQEKRVKAVDRGIVERTENVSIQMF